MGSRVRIRLFHILHFVMHFLFPLLKNSKPGIDDRGHRLRSGSPVTNLPGASTRGTSVPSGVLFCKSFERVLHSSVPFHKYFEHPYLLANQLNSNLYDFWPIKIQMSKVGARVATGGEVLRAVFHQEEFSARNNIFFCLLTPTLRQLVFNQKKMSFSAENSA